LRLGQTNALFCDSIVVGRGKCDSATPSMIFNGTFTSPTAYFRGTNGTPRVSSWVIGDGFGGHSSTAFAYGTCDFTGGSVDALVDTLVVGRGSSPSISGANIPGTGTLTLAAGNMDINTLQVGYTTTVGNGTGTVNLNGGNLLVNSSLEFAHTGGSGTLNISAGTAILNAGAVSGGGTSAINMTGGTLVATNSAMPVGTVVSPIGTVVVANGTLNLAARNLGATVEAGTLNGGGLMNTINISSVPTLTNLPTQLPVIQYTTPAGDLTTFVIGTMPGTFKGYISNNTANSTIDLVITNGPVFPVMVWDGAHSADWDTSTPNWKTNGIAADYSQNYPVVLFDDSLTGSTNVNLTTALTPGSLLANNSLSNYVFTGAGSLGGSLTLVKSGTGALTLAETGGDNFSGGLVINNGTLILDNANGNMSGGTTINNSGILQVGKNDANGSLPSGGIALGGQLTINRFSSLTVSNTISGSGTILQTGSGVTTLTGNNTFSGPVVINQGTLQVGSTNGIGTTTSVTASNGTFDVNGFTLFGNGNTGLNVNVAGSGAGGAGAIVNSGASQTRVLHSVTLLGDATFGGNGDWDIRNSAGNSASADAQLVGAFNLTKVGTNSVQLRGVTVDTGLSNIIVQAGTFTVTATASAPQNSLGDPNGLITVQTNAQLTLDSIGTIPTKDIVLTNGGTFKSSGTNTFNSQLTTTGAANNIISVNTGAQLTVTTPIVGPGGISKNGSSTLFLNAANTYIGTTVVSGGTLALYGGGFDGSIASSTNINVTSGATLDVSGRSDQMLTVANGQTLSGGVGTNGPGVINGIVIVPAAAILAPGGTTNTGVLSISSNLTLNGSTVMKLNAQAGTNDQVSAANISYGGTLTVTNVAGTLAAGNSFQLFIATNNYSNAFTVTNLPTLAAGLSWSNSLALDGKVTVVSSAPPPQPYITSVSFVGTTLIINGTNGTSGQQFEVFASTNLSVALSNWTSISTNTFTGNSFSVTNTISPTPPRSFFIIRLP
jgi:autotransporter-associated beta strand protein